MKEIKLTRGLVALVDDEDFEWLNQWKWHAHGRKGFWYAARNHTNPDGSRITVRMHRVIMGVTDPKIQVDHINGVCLNNQRSNLRICTQAENSRNKRKMPGKSSRFKGVWKRGELWATAIEIEDKKIHLGTFDTEEQAAAAYDAAAKIHHGEFCSLNNVSIEHLIPARITPRTNKSGFLGVYQHYNGWRAQVKIKRKTCYLGTFNTAEEAARVRDAKALELFGPDIGLNFR